MYGESTLSGIRFWKKEFYEIVIVFESVVVQVGVEVLRLDWDLEYWPNEWSQLECPPYSLFPLVGQIFFFSSSIAFNSIRFSEPIDGTTVLWVMLAVAEYNWIEMLFRFTSKLIS